MGQILHGSARTTEAVRRAIQHSQGSLRVLVKRYGINQKTVAKWKKRTAVKDLPTGPADIAEVQTARASCGCSWRSTGPASPPSSSCTAKQAR